MTPEPLHDQLSILKSVAARLDAAPIPYMVTGSIAAGHYGRPRMTRDIDIVIAIETAEAPRLVAALGDDFGLDVAQVSNAIARKAMFNAIHETAIIKVDFVVRKDDPFRLEEFERRRQVDIDRQAIWMVTAEDLVLSKLLWSIESASELQSRDAAGILRVQDKGIDWHYLRGWAARLGVAEQLERLL